MKTEDIKKQLIIRIQNTSDDLLLEDVLKFFDIYKETEIYQLSNEEENSLSIAKEDIKQGNSYTQKEVDEKLYGIPGKTPIT